MAYKFTAGAPFNATDIIFDKMTAFSMKYFFKTLNNDSLFVSVVYVFTRSTSS